MCSISKNKLAALISHYRENGLAVRRKKSGGRKSNIRCLSFDDVKAVVTFISNCAEQHALLLPGRVPAYKRSDIRLLPSAETKASVWRKYKTAMEMQGCYFVSTSLFFLFYISFLLLLTLQVPDCPSVFRLVFALIL